jgi:regulator of nucleoside diphosphate kinase
VILNRRTFSAADTQRLAAAIDRAASYWLEHVPHLDAFRSVVRRGNVLAPADVPPDVITMNSRFAVENVNTGDRCYYALAYPEEAALRRGWVSVLSPAGMALLGAREGEEVCWTSNAGPEVARVVRIFHQPEASMRASARVRRPRRQHDHTAVLSRN